MLSDMKNQRISPRLKPRQPTTCRDQTRRPIGRVMNLSESGIMLMSKEPAQVNDSRIMKLDLPLTPNHQITISGEIIWCQQSSFSEEYGIGIQIINIDDLARVALNRYLKEITNASAA